MPRHLEQKFDGFMIGEIHFMALRFDQFEVCESLIEVASTSVRGSTFWYDRSQPLQLGGSSSSQPYDG